MNEGLGELRVSQTLFYHSVAVARLSRPHLNKISYKPGLAVHEKRFSDML